MRVVLTENVFFSEIENDFLKKKKKNLQGKIEFSWTTSIWVSF